MCLILISFRQHRDYPLIVAANRDEFFDRASSAAGFWGDSGNLFGGRDLEAGGSWLAVTRGGRYAAVTNFRGGEIAPDDLQSRGELVGEFLSGAADPGEYLASVERNAGRYNGFNLLVGTPSELHYFSNREPGGAPRELLPGLYGLSNHLLDTPWPKVVLGKRRLAEQITKGAVDPQNLIKLLGDRTAAPSGELPDTGVDPELERRLSPIFLTGDQYGTRCSTVIIVNASGRIEFHEHSYDRKAAVIGRIEQEFELTGVAA